MKDREFKLRATIVLGWSMMLMLVLAMFVVNLSKSAIAGDFSDWPEDMSYNGLMMMLVIMCIYAFVPMLVLTLQAHWFRYLVAALGVLMTIFFAKHEIGHLLAGEMPLGVRHVLDFSHHILGLWVTVAAVKWARIPAQEAAASEYHLTREA